MQEEEKIKMFKDVFKPKSGEKVLFLVDIPHDDIKDNKNWSDRREMANEWYNTFKNMAKKEGFTVEMHKYNATGVNNTPVPQSVIDKASKSNLVIAMTEYSGSSSFKPMCQKEGAITRCASMPGVERRMEKSAFLANYYDVKIYANSIKKMLTKAIGAEVLFSTGDRLFIDLCNRMGSADEGDCSKPGQTINFPSGEGYIAPYEGENKEIGDSKTNGILPDYQPGVILKYKIKNNKIVDIIGKEKESNEKRKFFNEKDSRRNIAELGVGCNPKAVVTGNILEDEKVGGLHIAYGMSSHIGGTVKSDMHQDICFPKGAPVEAKSLTLLNEDETKVELIKNAVLRYDLLK